MISGGHLTPALAFIEYIKKIHPNATIYFVGRKYSKESEGQLANEKLEAEKLGAVFIPFNSGKIGVGSIFSRIINSLRLSKGLVKAFTLVPRLHPDVFVSFGGYLAVPLAIASWFWRVPVITHEQTRTFGVANRVIGQFSKKIALAYPESAESLPQKKVVVVGNPIRQVLSINSSSKKPEWYKTNSKKPLLYVTGGSQGSEIINTTISLALSTILRDWTVVHQCGQLTNNRDYAKELIQSARTLSKEKRDRYYVRPWIESEELSWIYQNTTAIISRAGANTVAEIAHLKIPSILVPIPFAHLDEQLLNAKALSETGGSILLLQKDLNPQSLLASLNTILAKPASFKKKLQKLDTNHTDASSKLFTLIEPYLN